jgi:hypothetical protein
MENMEFLKGVLAEINAKMDTTQEKMDANTKEMQVKVKDMMKSQIGFRISRMEAAMPPPSISLKQLEGRRPLHG